MELKGTDYYIQDLRVKDIAKEYGTPLYVYDFEKIESQYNRLTNAFKHTKLKVMYACKALTNISVLKFLKKWVAELIRFP